MNDFGERRPPTEREDARLETHHARPATERDVDGALAAIGNRPPTEREDGVADGQWGERRPPTERDDDDPARASDGYGDGMGGSGTAWSPIPDSLSGRFEYVRDIDIDAAGAEAMVYLVRSLQTGQLLLAKLYNRKIELKKSVLETIKGINSDHVVKLHGFGILPDTRQWCEVQEYVKGGNLLALMHSTEPDATGRRRLDPRLPLFADVVSELNEAIAAFHAAGLVHHDIKPENILVRRAQPLDLVLADFGLSIAADRTVFLSRRTGTIAYDAPESLGAGQGGRKRDYWALGMTLAELAAGRHPFSIGDRQGEFLSVAAIRDHLFERRPINLSGVDEPRARKLCEGLTRYDEDNRWGREEVAAWLRGADPAVLPDRRLVTAAASQAHGLPFAGRRCQTREELATAMAADWRASVAVLGSAQKRHEFLDQVSSTFGSNGITELEASWALEAPGVDRAITDVIVALDPAEAPVVACGLQVDREHLPALARSVASGDATATRAIVALYSQHCLLPLARLPGQEDLATIDRTWHEMVEAFASHIRRAREAGAVLTIADSDVQAQLLAAIADDRFARELAGRRGRRVDAGAQRQEWYRPLASPRRGDHAAALAGVLLADEAVRLAAEQESQRRRERQERLADSVRSLRAWLRWPIATNAVVAVGTGVVHFRRDDLVEAVTRDGELDAWVEPLLQWAVHWRVWTAMAIAAIVARYTVRGARNPSVVRLAQAISVVTTAVVPPLGVFGLVRAFRTRRRRAGAQPSGLRKCAVGGSVATGLALIGLWANRTYSLFRKLFDAWPEGVQTWYLENWPPALDPGALNERFDLLVGVGLVVLVVGLGSAWVSYTQASTLVTAGESVGALSGVLYGVGGLPVFGTGVALLAWGAAMLALGILAVVIVAWLLFAILEDLC